MNERDARALVWLRNRSRFWQYALKRQWKYSVRRGTEFSEAEMLRPLKLYKICRRRLALLLELAQSGHRRKRIEGVI